MGKITRSYVERRIKKSIAANIGYEIMKLNINLHESFMLKRLSLHFYERVSLFLGIIIRYTLSNPIRSNFSIEIEKKAIFATSIRKYHHFSLFIDYHRILLIAIFNQ